MKDPQRHPGLWWALSLCLLCLWAAGALGAQESETRLADQVTAELKAGRLEAALDKAQVAVRRYPKSSHLQQLLGVVLYKLGMNEEARTALQHAIEYDSSVPQNYFDLALVDVVEEHYSDASKALETYLYLDRMNAQAHVLLGRAYLNLNQTAPAIEQFKKALALNPVLPLAHYHFGVAYQSLGNLQSALEQFYLEIRVEPEFSSPHWRAGNIELELGKLPEAEKLFEEAIRLNPRVCQPHYGLGRIYTERRQFPKAEKELTAALKFEPDNVRVHYALARLYQQMGNKEAASREFAVCATLHARQEKQLSGIAGAGLQR